ncbi:MAG: hypothetical protein K6U87_04345 [Firmicutes bacterium]|nr:hypothetical protein [Bacillota bacterium]
MREPPVPGAWGRWTRRVAALGLMAWGAHYTVHGEATAALVFALGVAGLLWP